MRDVVIVDHSLIFQLLSSVGQSPLVRKGVFFDLDLPFNLSTVSDVSTSSVFVLPVHVSHEYRERRSLLRYHGCGKCAVCLTHDYFRHWTDCNLKPTHTRWNEPWQHAVLTMSCQRQVNRRRGRCQHTRCKSALYPGHVRAVFSHNAFHKNMFDDSGSKQEIQSPIESSISLCP